MILKTNWYSSSIVTYLALIHLQLSRDCLWPPYWAWPYWTFTLINRAIVFIVVIIMVSHHNSTRTKNQSHNYCWFQHFCRARTKWKDYYDLIFKYSYFRYSPVISRGLVSSPLNPRFTVIIINRTILIVIIVLTIIPNGKIIRDIINVAWSFLLELDQEKRFWRLLDIEVKLFTWSSNSVEKRFDWI